MGILVAQTTKRALEASLKKLLLRKPLNKITISDITEDCGVNRMTFYYHFKDIYDLVDWILMEDAAEALEGLQDFETWSGALREMLEKVQANRVLVLNVYRSVSREQVEQYLYKMLDPLLRRVPPAVGVAVSALLFWGTYPTMNGFWNLPGGRLALPQALYASYTTAYLGFMPKSFFSTDYFPLLPWLFLFWVGYFLHHLVGRRRLAPLRRSVCPPLGWMGRHSLVLYLLHQPVILGVLTVAFRLVRAG